MTDPSTAHRADTNASIALSKIEQHLLHCAKRYDDMSNSIRRLHDRIDENFETRQKQFDQTYRDNKVVLVTVLVAAASSVVSIVLHFWK